MTVDITEEVLSLHEAEEAAAIMAEVAAEMLDQAVVARLSAEVRALVEAAI